MKRVVISTFVVLFFSGIWQALALYLPTFLNVLFLAPLVVVFSLRHFRPLETLAICLFAGSIIDVLSGSLIGINMLLTLGFVFALGTKNVSHVRMSRYDFWFYIGTVSFVYRLVFFIFHFLCFGFLANFYLWQFLLGPLVDIFVGQIFFYGWATILVWTKGLDQNEYFKARIGSHS